ncbi:phage/plasmid primase, P4 family [Paenibacillus urinalis]|uniref:Phage/plasmid primase, P4 family n=1 Tax=Paenibacillus urinalis TaxID=521520 RepID=A0ABY7X9A0_9BACL|nr:phage/plasmid primase, P4 family [Paenibacillus urinalis]WDH98699.1 phage/plasmid primase, P4 family [Paenibacillus urinalis]WDI02392.1 phage/plasmid primase, P4 family [Paenibacillus urinalis]
MDQQQLHPAAAPEWMVNRMTKQTRTLTADSNLALQKLVSRCKVFAEDWTTQQQSGLDEETWFKWLSLLFHSAGADSALEFSKASIKHGPRSQERLRDLQKSEKKRFVRCRTLGCDEQKIAECFAGQLRRNEKGTITNSPARFLLSSYTATTPSWKQQVDPSQIGLEVSKKTGRLIGINGNIYARYILQKKLDLIYSNDRFYVYQSSGVWKFEDSNRVSRILRGILHSFVPDSWTPKLELDYISALKVEAPRVDKMDPNRKMINLANGMLDLEEYQLVPHDKRYYSTIQVPIHYDPTAKCPTFLQYLSDIFQNDQELIELTAEMQGYCLTTEVKAHKAFILYGKGSNGKSVLAEILNRLCGIENVSSVSLGELDNSFARSELVDKILNLATENEVGKSGFDTTYFKSIVSGDTIRVERKHEQGFSYQPFCKLVFALNNFPYTKDKSYGFLRRLVILPFNKTFKEEKADVNLLNKLTEELSGILNFALSGLKRLEANGYRFTKSQAANNLLKEFSEELNPVECFVDEMIVKGSPEDRVKNKDIGTSFKQWCQRQGHGSLAQYSQIRLLRNIREILQSKGIKTEVGNAGDGRYTKGIKLMKNPNTLLNESVSVGDIEDIT